MEEGMCVRAVRCLGVWVEFIHGGVVGS
jgi:hypothetical protein